MEKYFVREGSVVYFGAQPGARVIKHLDGGDVMDLETVLTEVKSLKKGLEERLDALEKGERATDVEALVADGKAFRDFLRAETTRLARILSQGEQADLL